MINIISSIFDSSITPLSPLFQPDSHSSKNSTKIHQYEAKISNLNSPNTASKGTQASNQAHTKHKGIA